MVKISTEYMFHNLTQPRYKEKKLERRHRRHSSRGIQWRAEIAGTFVGGEEHFYNSDSSATSGINLSNPVDLVVDEDCGVD